MALYTRKQFAHLCGIKLGNLGNYQKRGKLFLEDGLINSDHLINEAFLHNQLSLKAVRDARKAMQSGQKDDDEILTDQKNSHVKQETISNKSPFVISPRFTQKLKLENELKEISLLKLKEETELLKSKNQKNQSLLISTALFKNLIEVHTNSMKSAFGEAVEVILIELSKKAILTEEEKNQFLQELKESINSSAKNNEQLTKKSINNVVKEYSETRGVGEKR